jgi:hypothetical protein
MGKVDPEKYVAFLFDWKSFPFAGIGVIRGVGSPVFQETRFL